MKEIKTYHFSVCLFGKWETTPVRSSEKEAWADCYKLVSGKTTRWTSMTLVVDTAYVKEEGEQ